MLRFDVVALMTEPFFAYWGESIMKRAIEAGLVECNATNLRDFTENKHKTVDDMPYGGGVGMVMKPEPLFKCVESIKSKNDFDSWDGDKKRVIALAPTGKPFNQKMAEELSSSEHLIFICGRYEAMDQRVHDHLVDMEISLGDYILTGGELAAMTIIDAVTRLIPGAIGGEDATLGESFSCGYLEYPQYTRPPIYREWAVPEVLLSGNHKEIEHYHIYEALKRTVERRPDLINEHALTPLELKIYHKLLCDLEILREKS